MPVCPECENVLKEGDRFCSNCGASIVLLGSTHDPMVGRTIGGAYVVLEPIGVGGMGRVYRAEQRMLGRTVAIKFIHQHLLSDQQTLARFYTEARAASRLNHPNSVSIIDFGKTEDDILYLVMEYLQGKDLATLMNDEGPLPLLRVIDIIISVLNALGEAHALEVVHRDLKPENIFVERTRSGRDLVKVVDFGLAKLLGGGQLPESITLPGLACGTPDYMSPEQGRGEPMDGRGDIYSVGVLLFELLTERLPFSADTPTNIVLKHIQDPVPDPRQIAPHRNIPLHLADIVMCAMRKNPADRYQTAEEMIDALRQGVNSMVERDEDKVTCSSCGTLSPRRKRFCAECGAPLISSIPAPPRRISLQARASLPPPAQRPLADRSEELQLLQRLRAETLNKLVSVSLSGEPGVGKTRLLSAVLESAARDGDLVARAGPHDSGAPVPYWPIITLLGFLYDTDYEGLKHFAQEAKSEEGSLADAGLNEVINPTGLTGAERRSRAGAVACALATAIRVALRRRVLGRMVIVVDDFERCDGLSRQTIQQLGRFVNGISVFLVTACSSADTPLLPDDNVPLVLHRIPGQYARQLASAIANRTELQVTEDRPLLPLYVEQVQGLGMSVTGLETAPSRLADVVAQRVQRLNISARRALQCAAVLGYRCSRASLTKLAGQEDTSSLESLREQGFVFTDGDYVEISHPFIRDLIEAFIPAEARRNLHERALRLTTDLGAPLEVRAAHAYRAGEAFRALMILEQMGNMGAQRGDFDTAALAFQRGLELARKELLETGDVILDTAVATFSYKLGDALTRSGDPVGAEGVLREALGLTDPVSRQRARMMVGLSKVVAMRKRFRDAFRLLDQTLEIARDLESDEVRSETYLGVAWVRNLQGDKRGKAESLKAACDLLKKVSAPPLERAAVEVDLASAWLEIGELQRAHANLENADQLAQQAQSPHLIGKVSLLLGQLTAQIGDQPSALERYHRATRFAAQAGDADTVRACEEAFTTIEVDSMKTIEVVGAKPSARVARLVISDSPTQNIDKPKEALHSKLPKP